MPTLLLTEIQLKQVIAILVESKKEEFLKNKYNVDDKVIDVAKEIDPTPNNKYMEWLISRNVVLWNLDYDRQRVRKYLKLYSKDKIRKSLPKEYQDINSFKYLSDFSDVMREINPADFVSKTEAYEQTYKGRAGKYKVYQPTTYVQSCKLGSGTNWCTAASGGEDSFNKYTEDDNILLIFIDGDIKYQYSTNGEFKNKKNNDVNIPKDIFLWLADNGYEKLTLSEKVNLLGMPLEEALDGDLHIRGNLNLYNNIRIKELPDGLWIGGYLDLTYTNIEKLPNDLYVGGSLILFKNETLKELPDGLYVGGKLHLEHTKIEKLPDDLYVGDYLNLYKNEVIKELPNGLRVEGELFLTHTNIEKLPNDLYVGGNLKMKDTPLTKYTDDEIRSMVKYIGGEIVR